MEIDQNFREFIQLLNAARVKYLVIGGFAVNFHGYPRYTKDIAFWVWMDDTNVDRLMQAINQFGFGSLGLVADDFSDPDAIIQLGYEPYRIDLLMNVEGVDFADCYARRTEAELDSTPIKFLSLRDLIKAKQAAGRLQDLADAEQLEKLSQKQVLEEE